jgi:hypothetical protein
LRILRQPKKFPGHTLEKMEHQMKVIEFFHKASEHCENIKDKNTVENNTAYITFLKGFEQVIEVEHARIKSILYDARKKCHSNIEKIKRKSEIVISHT